MALSKVKPEHAQYYRVLKRELEKHLGGASNKEQDSWVELKKLAKSVHELETVTRASGDLDAHTDIKQVKLIRSKLSDANRLELCKTIATTLTI